MRETPTHRHLYHVTLQKTSFPGVYLAVGSYSDEEIAVAVYTALRHNVVKGKYDKKTLHRIEYDNLPYAAGAKALNRVLLRSSHKGEEYVKKD